MTITPSIRFDDQVGITDVERANLTRTITLALSKWSDVLAGSGTANIIVEIMTSTESGRAQGGPAQVTTAARFADGTILGEGTLSAELRSGANPNTDGDDLRLLFSIDYLRKELWFDPTPATSDDVPSNRTDALSVILHELGHGLAFSGYGEALDGLFRSPYDLRVVKQGGAPYFSGPNVLALVGHAVPLTPGNYTHYGTVAAPPGSGDPLAGLMNGLAYYRGARYAISDLDLAIMADAGLGTVRNDIFDETWLADIDGGAGVDIFKADYGARTESLRVVRDLNGDIFVPSSLKSLAAVHLRNVERLDLKLGGGNDEVMGGTGDDRIDAGAGADVMSYAAASTNFSWSRNGDGSWTVRDLRPAGGEGVDTLINVESLKFSDKTVSLKVSDAQIAVDAILRGGNGATAADLDTRIAAGTLTASAAIAEVVKAAAATTSVASLSYQFFTGKVPSQVGVDFLISPTGPNATNLNSAYYAKFDVVNRYINFAVNLGKNGEAKDGFTAKYGGFSLFDATKEAYKAIFGAAPTDAKVHALIDTRVDYLAYYGGDGPSGVGTKAAMVGFLLAAAATEHVGVLARSNDAWLTDLSDGSAPFAVNIVDPSNGYWKADFVFGG